ncbi:hypothetical protein ACHAXA_004610 [Cyclostephanos tholiformis]|uniref:Uncharacterized protein n=1 Tax=Cyclostephanos tholiformis TaxID=382380 RepID=A0ABD3SNX5_9STRA
MKIIVASVAILSTAAAHAADPVRKRTVSKHRSSSIGNVMPDEAYEPNFGTEHRSLVSSMSVQTSMSMMPTYMPTYAPSTYSPTSTPITTTAASGAATIGTTVAACAAAGVAMLL